MEFAEKVRVRERRLQRRRMPGHETWGTGGAGTHQVAEDRKVAEGNEHRDHQPARHGHRKPEVEGEDHRDEHRDRERQPDGGEEQHEIGPDPEPEVDQRGEQDGDRHHEEDEPESARLIGDLWDHQQDESHQRHLREPVGDQHGGADEHQDHPPWVERHEEPAEEGGDPQQSHREVLRVLRLAEQPPLHASWNAAGLREDPREGAREQDDAESDEEEEQIVRERRGPRLDVRLADRDRRAATEPVLDGIARRIGLGIQGEVGETRVRTAAQVRLDHREGQDDPRVDRQPGELARQGAEQVVGVAGEGGLLAGGEAGDGGEGERRGTGGGVVDDALHLVLDNDGLTRRIAGTDRVHDERLVVRGAHVGIGDELGRIDLVNERRVRHLETRTDPEQDDAGREKGPEHSTELALASAGRGLRRATGRGFRQDPGPPGSPCASPA